jgi:hypothetical protein
MAIPAGPHRSRCRIGRTLTRGCRRSLPGRLYLPEWSGREDLNRRFPRAGSWCRAGWLARSRPPPRERSPTAGCPRHPCLDAGHRASPGRLRDPQSTAAADQAHQALERVDSGRSYRAQVQPPVAEALSHTPCRMRTLAPAGVDRLAATKRSQYSYLFDRGERSQANAIRVKVRGSAA